VSSTSRRADRAANSPTRSPHAAEPSPPSDDASAGPLTDIIRRFVAVGLSGFFNTEGAVRKAFGDTVPQEWIDFVTEQSERSRQEMFDRLAAEAGRVLERTNIEELLENLLTGRTIEIEAKFRIGPRTPDAGEDDETEPSDLG